MTNTLSLPVLPRLMAGTRAKVETARQAASQKAATVDGFDKSQEILDQGLLTGILELVACAKIHKAETIPHLHIAAWTIERPLIAHQRKVKAVADAVGIVLQRAMRQSQYPLTGEKELAVIGPICTFLKVNNKTNEALMLLDVLETQQAAQDPESEALATTRRRRQDLIVNQSEGAPESTSRIEPSSLPAGFGLAPVRVNAISAKRPSRPVQG